MQLSIRTKRGFIMKHLNVTKSEVCNVVVDFEVNKFVAYIKHHDGSTVVFNMAYSWADMVDNSEFIKYRDDWKLPIDISKMARLLSNSTHK